MWSVRSDAEVSARLGQRANLPRGDRPVGLVQGRELILPEPTVVGLREGRHQREGLGGRVTGKLVDELMKALTSSHSGSVRRALAAGEGAEAGGGLT